MRMKNTLIISSYVLVAALLFSGAYVAGRTGMSRDIPAVNTADNNEIPETVPESAVHTPEYEVIYEDGKIIIYKCIGEIRSVVTSENVSEGVFPKADMDALRKGVRFERLENAQQMFENFVS